MKSITRASAPADRVMFEPLCCVAQIFNLSVSRRIVFFCANFFRPQKDTRSHKNLCALSCLFVATSLRLRLRRAAQYRGIAFRRALPSSGAPVSSNAGPGSTWRYSRLQLCATRVALPVLLAGLLASNPIRALGAPADAVSVREDDATYTLDNVIVSARVAKAGGGERAETHCPGRPGEQWHSV